MRLTVLSFLFLPVLVFSGDDIAISNAWISEGPPTARVTAGYMDIVNNSDEHIDLVAAGSSLFERVEFHLTMMEKGVASMQKQDVIPLPARSSFSFAPGRYHLMLFDSSVPLKAGDVVPLRLTFSNGKSLDIAAEVRRSDFQHTHH